ncbi:hypothetical protein NP493_142g03011 [Ridgeia piscesae]|uniref:G-protein coupled receptors family 1 profile domain-containing protein n=1 Tax=Ridgeia piscesae TaxID=27915 RepID=A0AAD9UG39_RIDPI|nr:hypothetical protein NP493_142g03011 [Ridgeia piscesae]
MGSGGRAVERRTVNRGDGGSIPPTAVSKLGNFFTPHLPVSFGRDTKSRWSLLIIWYLVSWVPFHVVFDISTIDPERVPELVYTITFWLTYFNSTLNPFLYAFSNKDFQNAFKRVIKCQC